MLELAKKKRFLSIFQVLWPVYGDDGGLYLVHGSIITLGMSCVDANPANKQTINEQNDKDQLID